MTLLFLIVGALIIIFLFKILVGILHLLISILALYLMVKIIDKLID